MLKLIESMEDISPCVPEVLHELITKVLPIKKARGAIVVVEPIIYFTF